MAEEGEAMEAGEVRNLLTLWVKNAIICIYYALQEEAWLMTTDTLRCKYCNKIFDQTVFWQRFCCKECRVLYWEKVQKEKYEFNKRLEKIEERLGMSDDKAI